jgi:hypothetical protein
MNKILTGVAGITALMLGLNAYAGCAPQAGAQQGATEDVAPANLFQGTTPSHLGGKDAGEQIVGTWHAVYAAGGSVYAQAFIQWHSDGTEWENITKPTLGGNICMGSWKQVDHSHVFRNHFGWIFTNGMISGYFNETETDELSWDGNSYAGLNDTKIYSLAGKFIEEIPGTVKATRLAP